MNASKLKIEIITLFPSYFDGPLRESILGRGIREGLYNIETINLREFGLGKHKVVDNAPFGGGGGMALMLEPLTKCLESLGYSADDPNGFEKDCHLILTSAAGKKFEQKLAVEYSLARRLTIICGHYLGVDERLLSLFPMEEISIGDFTLTGGEPAAAVMVDAVCRLVPGALRNFSSAQEDSHQEGILGAPVYTRPEIYREMPTPKELLSGDHKKVKEYRRQSALEKTERMRPDLLRKKDISESVSPDKQNLAPIQNGICLE
ncbi:MAG: tRNA (guanosine(37)-N1)-methyltransferase TrmD [candidate division Zixibacteria bacterium]|nr:tRNA (guanosine(37)-N1)-methyltransferase TrmD [candidate division Zixibacteria bacterium]